MTHPKFSTMMPRSLLLLFVAFNLRFDSSSAWLSSSTLPCEAGLRRQALRRMDFVVLRNQRDDELANDDDNDDDNNQSDLFEYFDPLLSPHAYPKGVNAGQVASAEVVTASTQTSPSPLDAKMPEESYDMLGWGSGQGGQPSASSASKSRKIKVFGIDLPETVSSNTATSSAPTNLPLSTADGISVFDPTLSPHMYTKGVVPSVIVGDEGVVVVNNGPSAMTQPPPRRTIGVLLIDHGSRNEASNQRLHSLAQLYQEQQQQNALVAASSSATVITIVQAAHMEIASPSIEQGLQALLQDHPHLDEIVCHPYFLSPGRHVVDDIPALLAAAVSDLNIEIPVRLTPPVGSRTDTMLTVIDALVQDTLQVGNIQ